MAVVAREPGDHAPVAGADAVERLVDAAEPLRGARVLHVSRGRGRRRVAERCSARCCRWRRAWACGSSGGCCSGATTCARPPPRSTTGCRAPRPRSICRRALGGLPGRVRAGRPPRSATASTPSCCTTPARWGSPRRSRSRVVWRCHVDASAPDRAGRCERARRADRALRRRWCSPTRSFAPEQLQGDAAHRGAGHRSARRARNLEPRRGSPAGCVRLARPRPVAADVLPGDAAGPLEGPARDARGLRARAGGAARPPAGAGLARRGGRRVAARSRRLSDYAGRPGRTCSCSPATTGVGRARAGRPAAPGAGEPAPRAARGLRPGRVGGAVEGHAGDRRPRRRGAAAGARRRRRLPDRRRAGDGRAAGRAGARPGRRWRWAAPAASTCASATWSPGRSRDELGLLAIPWSAHERSHLPDGTPLELPDGATGADAAGGHRRRAWRARRWACRWTATCATSRRRCPTAPIEIVTGAGRRRPVADAPRRRPRAGRRRCIEL